jgi:predicted GNAT family acetyltransferase
MTTNVTANDDEGRYEITVDGESAGFTEFRLDGEVATFTHTEVGSQFEGQGVASELIKEALADVRRRGWKVIPKCPFVREYIEKHPDYQDLLAE